MLKKLFIGFILAFPFVILLALFWSISAMNTPGDDNLGDLKDFIRNSGADMRGKISPPPEFALGESATFDVRGCKPQSVFSSQRVKH